MKNIPIKLYDIEIKATDDTLSKFITSQNKYVPSGINMMNAPLMWNKGYKGNGVTIAIMDSGCIQHDDLKNNIIGGKNFTSEDNGNQDIYTDYKGHGTHCAGIIAGNGKIMGVAPNAKLLILKVLEKNGNGNLQSLYDAINYAISQKVDIISMSLGCSLNVSEIHTIIKKAVDNNIMIVCASGNSGDNNSTTNEIDYPAGYNEVISVGAIDSLRMNAKFTNSNKEVDIVAQGVDVISTHLNNGYCSMSGTSQATPHVSGALALLIERANIEWGRKLSETEIYAQLIKNTIDLGLPKEFQGNGMLFL